MDFSNTMVGRVFAVHPNGALIEVQRPASPDAVTKAIKEASERTIRIVGIDMSPGVEFPVRGPSVKMRAEMKQTEKEAAKEKKK